MNGRGAVGKYAVCTAGIRLYPAAVNGQLRRSLSILGIGQHAGVHAVKAAVVTGHISRRLGHRGVLQRCRYAGADPQSYLRLPGGIREGFPGVVAGFQLGHSVSGVKGHGTAAGRGRRYISASSKAAGRHIACPYGGGKQYRHGQRHGSSPHNRVLSHTKILPFFGRHRTNASGNLSSCRPGSIPSYRRKEGLSF